MKGVGKQGEALCKARFRHLCDACNRTKKVVFILNNQSQELKYCIYISCFFGQDVLSSSNILTGAFINLHFIFYGEHNVLGNLSMYQALNILMSVCSQHR